MLNQSDAILQQNLHLRNARRFSSESEASYLRIFSFLRMCGTSSATLAGSLLDAPPRRLVWPWRSVLLAAELDLVVFHNLRRGVVRLVFILRCVADIVRRSFGGRSHPRRLGRPLPLAVHQYVAVVFLVRRRHLLR